MVIELGSLAHRPNQVGAWTIHPHGRPYMSAPPAQTPPRSTSCYRSVLEPTTAKF
jgi:hypothetical protein